MPREIQKMAEGFVKSINGLYVANYTIAITLPVLHVLKMQEEDKCFPDKRLAKY